MLKLSVNKYEALERLSNEDHQIAALAIDQRGSLKKMISAASSKPVNDEDIIYFKKLISKDLTHFSSSILLDPEYGLPASKVRDENSGLLIAYEKTGYDTTQPGHLPDLLPDWSVRRLKNEGADAIKFMLYYDVDEDIKINNWKHAFVERVGSECKSEDIPFFLELVTYDKNIEDVKGKAFAKVKPHKVINMIKEFSKPQYLVDVLKVEVPVNMDYVEGFAAKGEEVYSRKEAIDYFKSQSDATDLPFIFLSAGVTAKLFQTTLQLASEAKSEFNGVLCGRATWRNSIECYGTGGEKATVTWLQSQGKKNMDDLNAVLKITAKPWTKKVCKLK